MSIVRIYGFDQTDQEQLLELPSSYPTPEAVHSLIGREWRQLYNPNHYGELTEEDMEEAQKIYMRDVDFYPNLDSALDQVKYWKDMEYRRSCFQQLLNNLIQKYNFRPLEADFYIDIDQLEQQLEGF